MSSLLTFLTLLNLSIHDVYKVRQIKRNMNAKSESWHYKLYWYSMWIANDTFGGSQLPWNEFSLFKIVLYLLGNSWLVYFSLIHASWNVLNTAVSYYTCISILSSGRWCVYFGRWPLSLSNKLILTVKESEIVEFSLFFCHNFTC